MFPWMRDLIAEAWHNRKSSRSVERQKTLSSVAQGSTDSDSRMLMPLVPSPENFPINVISIEGNVLNLAVKSDFTIERIKGIAIQYFYGQDNTKTASQYRLIHSSKFKQLIDNCSIDDEEISEYDELMLVQIRPPLVDQNLCEEYARGVNEEDIARVTSGLPTRNLPRPAPTNDCRPDFRNEIRKILITLVKTSAKILMHSPDAKKFCDILKDKLEARRNPPIDPKTVQTLVEMGYTQKRVLRALCLRKSNVTEALEWLTERQDEPDDSEDDDIDLSTVGMDVDEFTAGPSTSINKRKKSLKEACRELFKGSSTVQGIRRAVPKYYDNDLVSQETKKEENLVSIVELLLESFRRYKKMDFKPNSQMMQSLIKLGFEKKDVINALKITGNDQANAWAWLLGVRTRSLQDLDEGLDSDEPIYKAIMNNPHILLSLTNPKMLLAYLSMIETPASMNVWLHDPEVSPVFSLICKTYHTEKYAIHVNRYSAN